MREAPSRWPGTGSKPASVFQGPLPAVGFQCIFITYLSLYRTSQVLINSLERMSDSDQEDSLEDDPLACEESSQRSEPSSDDEMEDAPFEPAFSGTSGSDSESGSDFEEPPLKRPKRKTLKRSIKSYDWSTKSHPTSNALSRNPSGMCTVKEEHASLDPLTIFCKYFDDPFIRLIVKLTNDCASREGKKLELTEAELKAYIGMLIIMGFHKLPNIRNYWHSDPNLSVPRINKIMPLHRFVDISTYLCFSAEGKVYKKGEKQKVDHGMVRPLLDHLNEKFCQIRRPTQPLSIDESTVRPKSLKEQCHRSGEQYFSVLAIGCGKTGYVFRVNVRGLGKDFRSDCDNRVRDLLLPFEGSSYSVYIARKHCSFPLVEELHEKQIYACCELEQNDPNIPKDVRTKRLKYASGHFVQSEDFSITKWRDTQRHYAYIVSTFHNPSSKASVQVKNSEVKYPRVVIDYCNFKRGIRLFDHHRLMYSTSWKCYDWTKRLFYYMLDATLVNSRLVYESSWESMKADSGTRMSSVGFRSDLADKLIGGFANRKRESFVNHELRGLREQNSKMSKGHSAAKYASRLQDVGSHLPIKSTFRRCGYCSTRGKQKRSSVACIECDVALCIPCFAPFHKPQTSDE